MAVIIIDTETSGFPSKKLGAKDQAWITQIGVVFIDKTEILECFSTYIKPNGRVLQPGAVAVHGKDEIFLEENGLNESVAMDRFIDTICAWNRNDTVESIVGHNIDFDIEMFSYLFSRQLCNNILLRHPLFCTMANTIDLCRFPSKSSPGKFKRPKLGELYRFLFNKDMTDAHNALGDAIATAQCFMHPRIQEIYNQWK